MTSVFSRIVNGELLAHKVAENEKFMAFLDITPLQRGHTLVVPKKEVDYLFDIEDDLLQEMIVFSKKVATKIRKVFPCDRVGVAVIGLEVPHAHIHLIPINRVEDMNFSAQKLKLNQGELAEIAKQLREA